MADRRSEPRDRNEVTRPRALVVHRSLRLSGLVSLSPFTRLVNLLLWSYLSSCRRFTRFVPLLVTLLPGPLRVPAPCGA